MGDTQAGGQRGLVGQWDKAADILQIDLYHVKTSSSVQCNYLPYRTTFPGKIQGEKRDFPPLFPFSRYARNTACFKRSVNIRPQLRPGTLSAARMGTVSTSVSPLHRVSVPTC